MKSRKRYRRRVIETRSYQLRTGGFSAESLRTKSGCSKGCVWITGGREFDGAEPVFSHLASAVRNHILTLRCQARQISQVFKNPVFKNSGSKLAVQRRYNINL